MGELVFSFVEMNNEVNVRDPSESSRVLDALEDEGRQRKRRRLVN